MKSPEDGMSQGISLKRTFFAGILGVIGFGSLSFAARPATVSLIKEEGNVLISATERKDGVWIDFEALANALNATSSRKQGKLIVQFSSHTVTIDPAKSVYSILLKGKKKAAAETFSPRLASTDPVFVPLDSIAALCRMSFTYHRQKRTLQVAGAESPAAPSLVAAKTRTEMRDEKVWVSLEDLAQALKLVTYSPQADRLSVVLPDFTILEFRNGDDTVYSRNAPYVRLNDPVLLFSGFPYITVRSIVPAFGIDAQWDSKEKVLMVPAKYGRIRDIELPPQFKVTMTGYEPKPMKFTVEEFSAFYQDPAPSYPADHNEVYESVRDVLTNQPIPQKTNDYGHVSGDTRLDLSAPLFGAPLEGSGLFEKRGPSARVSNAHMSWGFPLFRIQGGRDYVTMGGLNNHFNLVDQVTVSHSNDHYGDQNVNPVVNVRAGYGEEDVSVFQSTSVFSQVVDVKQKIVNGGVDFKMNFSPRHNVSLKLDQFFFQNEVKRIRASYDNLDFLQGILGDGFDLSVDRNDQLALTKSVFSDRHQMALAQAGYNWEGVAEISEVVGVSSYNDEAGKRVMGNDHLTRLQLGKRRTRLDLSYEKSTPNYRSLGNPLRYQDRQIYHVAPFLDLARWWKMFGEFRREENRVTVRQGLPPERQTYASGVNLFSFRKNVLRTGITEFDSALYGRRLKHNADYTHYFGRDSMDVGAGTDLQWTSLGGIFRRSASARLGYQILRESWQVSLNEELTRHRYYGVTNSHRTASATNGLLRVNKWKVLAHYDREPKYYNLPDELYTGSIRFGRQVKEKKIFDVFYAASSLKSNLTSPEVWRAGFEYVLDF
jgi:hypothetical protein